MQDIILTIEKLEKKYGNKRVLEDLNFEVYKGEFLSLLGSSGCGKTTLLRLLVGIETPTLGHIYKYGEYVTTKTPFERNIGIVFQQYSLLPAPLRCCLCPKLSPRDNPPRIRACFQSRRQICPARDLMHAVQHQTPHQQAIPPYPMAN